MLTGIGPSSVVQCWQGTRVQIPAQGDSAYSVLYVRTSRDQGSNTSPGRFSLLFTLC